MACLTGAGFVFLGLVGLRVDFDAGLDADGTDFFTTAFVAGFVALLLAAFAVRSLAAARVCSKLAIIADFSLFTRVKSSTRICSSSFALFAALS